MYFDTHAHYSDRQFDGDREQVLSMMRENGIGHIMNVCAAMDEIAPVTELADRYDFIYGAVGVHPSDVDTLTEKDMETIGRAAVGEKIRAIGEIGLDYHYPDGAPRDVQRKWFARQIELAKELKLPIIVHDRDAHADTADVLKACHAEEIGGVLHCFSGSVEMAREILNLGMYIAFGGSVTFKNARKPVEAAGYAPMDRILLETDCPYLTPTPCRGKRNCSLYLPFIADKIAQIRGISAEEVEAATEENAFRCFGIG